jgi:hypothetical protein
MLRASRCSAGKYAEAAGTLECEFCDAKAEADYVGDCAACPAGTFSDRLGSISNTCCKSGEAVSLASCKPCQVGFYQNMTGQSFCIQCPFAHTTSGPTGSEDPNDCYVSCFQGYYAFSAAVDETSPSTAPADDAPPAVATQAAPSIAVCLMCPENMDSSNGSHFRMADDRSRLNDCKVWPLLLFSFNFCPSLRTFILLTLGVQPCSVMQDMKE